MKKFISLMMVIFLLFSPMVSKGTNDNIDPDLIENELYEEYEGVLFGFPSTDTDVKQIGEALRRQAENSSLSIYGYREAKIDYSIFKHQPVLELKLGTQHNKDRDLKWDEITDGKGVTFTLKQLDPETLEKVREVSLVVKEDPQEDKTEIETFELDFPESNWRVYNDEGKEYLYSLEVDNHTKYIVPLLQIHSSGTLDALNKKLIMRIEFYRIANSQITSHWYLEEGTSLDKNDALTKLNDAYYKSKKGVGWWVNFKVPLEDEGPTVLRNDFGDQPRVNPKLELNNLTESQHGIVFADIVGEFPNGKPKLKAIDYPIERTFKTTDGKEVPINITSDGNVVDGYNLYFKQILTVTFKSDDNGTLENAPVVKEVLFGDKVEVPKTTPKNGYYFVGWFDENNKKVDLTKGIKKSMTLTAKHNIDIIPETDPDTGEENEPPENYVTVTFKADSTKGSLAGETKYYINPEADPLIKLGDIRKPKVLPNTGYKFIKWDKKDSFVITSDTIVNAEFKKVEEPEDPSVIPDLTPDEDEDRPEGYISVTFLPGTNGTLIGTTKYYIDPERESDLSNVSEPIIKPNKNWKTSEPKWNPEFIKTNLVKSGVDQTYIAQYIPLIGLEDKDKYEPTPQEIKVDVGEDPDPKDGISNKDELPDGTSYEFKEDPDTSTPGEKEVTVVVTYPDGSKDEVDTTVTVTDPTESETDADKYTPIPKDIVVKIGERPRSEDGVGNKSELPPKTTYEFVEEPDTKTPGDKEVLIKVNYPDGSSEIVKTRLIVIPGYNPDPYVPPKPDEGDIPYWVIIGPSSPTDLPEPSEPTSSGEGKHIAYIKGYPDGTVRPEGEITRAEAAAMISRLLDLLLFNDSKPSYSDTPSAWYNVYINAVTSEGIMRGYPDGTFKPNDFITRGEFATMLGNFDEENSGKTKFTDIIGHWAEESINKEVANGRILGYPDGTFRPDGNITRVEAATMLNRTFRRSVNEKGLATVENPETIKQFYDIDKNHWGYYEIVEASNTHLYERIADGEVPEVWKLIEN